MRSRAVMPPAVVLGLILLGAVFTCCLQAEPDKVLVTGAQCPTLQGKDAFGKEASSLAPPVVLLLCFEKSTGTDLNRELTQHGEAFLKDNRVTVAADMHAMPRFVRAFVYPSLRDLPHKLLLMESEEGLAPFPRKAGCVTVVRVEANGTVVSIDFIAPASVIHKVGSPTP